MDQRPNLMPALPSWAPLAAAGAFVLWAVSIWWMVANLETGTADTSALEGGVSALHEDMRTLAARVESLTSDLEGVREERDALVARVAELEDAHVQIADVSEASEEAESDVPEASPLFTNGVDRYNCRDFASFDEAQEALRVNGPGDPNYIDSNRNGVACEDFTYRSTTTASTVAPVPTPTPPPASTIGRQGMNAE